MNTEAEIHAINKKLSELVTIIEVIKDRRSGDKDDIKELSEKVEAVLISLNQLNLILKYKDGQVDGVSKVVKFLRFLIGSLVFVVIVGSGTLMFDMHTRLTILEAGIK